MSFLAIIGSLYFSTYGDIVANIQSGTLFPKNAGLTPCLLCWFARIFFYPLLPISLVGYINGDKKVFDYILSLAIPGVLLEMYHYTIQFTDIFPKGGCAVGVPCEDIQVAYFDIITIPFLAFFGFLLIALIAIKAKKDSKKSNSDLSSQDKK